MAIEVTPEMLDAYLGAKTTPAGLAAVLAIVERDYAIGPQGCVEPAPGEPMAYCQLARGHRGKHIATVEKAVNW